MATSLEEKSKMEKNIYKEATKLKLRFLYKGSITTEDLWSLTLPELDSIYNELQNKIKEFETESLLAKETAKNSKVQLQIDIVKDIFQSKLEYKERQENHLKIAQERAKIEKALQAKSETRYADMSEDQLKAELKKLK